MDVKADKRPYQLKKLSDHLIDCLAKNINDGAPYKLAARANGVSERSLYYWLSQGILDLEHDKKTIHTKLVQRLANVEMNEIIELRDKIRGELRGHLGAQWTLERAFYKYFGINAIALELSEKLDNIELTNLEKKDAIEKIKESKSI